MGRRPGARLSLQAQVTRRSAGHGVRAYSSEAVQCVDLLASTSGLAPFVRAKPSHRTTYGYDRVTMIRNQNTLCQSRSVRKGNEDRHGGNEISLRAERCIECNGCGTAC